MFLAGSSFGSCFKSSAKSFHEASVQDRDGAPAAILGVLKKAPHVRKIWADSGYRGQKLASALKKLRLRPELQIGSKLTGVKRFMFLYRCWIVEQAFA